MGTAPTVTGDTYSCDTSDDSISDSGNGLVDAGFRVGMYIVVSGFTESGNNDIGKITSVASNGSKITVDWNLADEAAGDTVTITCVTARGLADIFEDCVLEIYSGSQPSDADSAETGTKLCRITVSGGSFTPGSPANGLDWNAPSSGKLSKASGETWSGTNLATGTAGWFRLYDNMYNTGVDSSAKKIRLDGAVGTSGAQLNMSSTSLTSGATTTIDQFDLTLPAS
jgi:hypothetical protein